MNTDYFAPFNEIIIGEYHLRNALVKLDAWSSRKAEADYIDFELLPGLDKEIILSKDVLVELALGYAAGSWTIFNGYVTVTPKSVAARAKDEMIKLFRTTVTETFLDVTPQEIISFGLRKAGIQNFILSANNLPKKPRFTVPGKNVVEMIKMVNTTWGVNYDRYFNTAKTFYWQPLEINQATVYEFQYGQNIIDLTYKDGTGKLKTVLAPFVDHSQEISLIHPDVPKGRYVADTLHHYMDGRVLRTEIYFSLIPEVAA